MSDMIPRNTIELMFDPSRQFTRIPAFLQHAEVGVIPQHTSIIPIFHYLRNTGGIILAESPRWTLYPWVFRFKDLFMVDENQLYFDCNEKEFDGPVKYYTSDVSSWSIVRQATSHIDELKGREYIGFLVTMGDVRPYEFL